MYKLSLLGIAGLLFSGCGIMHPQMHVVMDSCESRPNFTSYVSCIKSEYKRNPGSSSVRSLYAQLDGINEDYQNGILSDVKAKAAARIAYDNTVGASNARAAARAAASAPITCTTIGYTTQCY
jgi:hypothetical protein